MLAPGTQLGPFEIQSLLGSGGMGEVYRARDSRLDRTVAIKIIPASFSSDSIRRQRFQREARAISALQHPNICTLYDVGQQDGADYLVMEYLEGETLGARLSKTRLSIEQVLTYGIEIANALDAAHARGIVHRDLKPGNIFLTSRGDCKVLDFGLARMETDVSPEAPTITRMDLLTSPGAAVGTMAYMSPEQARGETLDHRTDIFSMGSVLYEMATGHLAFPRKTPAMTFKAILDETPAPPSQFNEALPQKLDEIIGKALEKDRDLRYQSAAELRTDLKRFKRDTGSGRIHGAVQEPPVDSRIQSSRMVLIALLAVAMVLALAGTWYFRNRNTGQAGGQETHEVMRIARLTGSGRAQMGTISPDGRYIAYSLFNGVGKQSIVLRHVATDRELTIVQPAERVTLGLTFSRDNNYLYYVSHPGTANIGILYRVSVIGGDSQELVEDVETGVDFSPDGRQMAYLRYEPTKKISYVAVANSDGSEERVILRPKKLELVILVSTPAWSPDGRTLALTVLVPGRGHPDLMTIPAEGGEPTIVCSGWMGIDSLIWRNENQLIVNGIRQGFGTNQLWSVSYPGCSVHRITNDTNSYTGVSATEDFASILTLQRLVSASIWLVGKEGNIRQIGQSPGAEEGRNGLAWMKDGTILYTYRISEKWGLGIMNPDGSRATQLALDSHNYVSPSVSPDGDTIVVVSDRGGPPVAVWRMRRDGSAAKRLSASFGIRPTFSTDGKWVFFLGRKDGTYGLQKVPFEGGVQQFISEGTEAPIGDSLDSKLVATVELKDSGAMWRVAFTPVDGGQAAQFSSWILASAMSIDPPMPGFDEAAPRLSPDRKQIVYVSNKDGIENLWSRDFDGSHVKQLSHFTDSQHIFWFAVGIDGKIAVSRGTSTSDIVLIRTG
jgi:Tol biopolymer transport system component/predicted Ser/Thr protein kinase